MLTYKNRPCFYITKGSDRIYIAQSPNKNLVSDVISKIQKMEGWVAYDFYGNALQDNIVLSYLWMLQSDIDNIFRNEISGQVIWNILNTPIIVSQVRAEVLMTDFSQFQSTTEESVLAKIAPIIPLLSVGMYHTASKNILALPIDEFLTEERKQKWEKLLLSTNAIPL